jgi:hypothetical protein
MSDSAEQYSIFSSQMGVVFGDGNTVYLPKMEILNIHDNGEVKLER